MVRAHIAAILEDESFSLDTPRIKLAKETARHILELVSPTLAEFDAFASSLVEKLQPKSKTFGSRGRKTMWTKFHAMRCDDLAKLWTELFSSLGVKHEYTIDPLFSQCVNEGVLEGIVKSKICTEHSVQEPAELTKDKLNVLRFVAEYIVFRMKKRITLIALILIKLSFYCA